jgi:hypothetical protein
MPCTPKVKFTTTTANRTFVQDSARTRYIPSSHGRPDTKNGIRPPPYLHLVDGLEAAPGTTVRHQVGEDARVKTRKRFWVPTGVRITPRKWVGVAARFWIPAGEGVRLTGLRVSARKWVRLAGLRVTAGKRFRVHGRVKLEANT